MKGHAKKAKQKCILSSAGGDALHRISPDSTEDYETTGELSPVCAQVVLKCLYLARIGRPDLLWSENTLARSVKQVEQSLRQRLADQCQGGVLCEFGSRTFVSNSWLCEKQTAFSHSSAESEIISLGAGLRMDGLPALLFGECVLETLSKKPAERNLKRHQRDRVIHSHWSQLTLCRLTFPTALTQPNFTFSKAMRQ